MYEEVRKYKNVVPESVVKKNVCRERDARTGDEQLLYLYKATCDGGRQVG